MRLAARRHRRRSTVRRTACIVVHVACGAMLLASCGGQAARDETFSATPIGTDSAERSATPISAPPNTAPQFRVVIGDTTLTGRLFDNATARDFASQLPMTLTFADLHGVEKGAPLPRTLSVEGMPSGDDPQIGDLGYWAPSGNLVLYYGDVGFWTGIMRIGHFDGDMQAVAAQSGDFDATIELVP
jgi:hypothetical protein